MPTASYPLDQPPDQGLSRLTDLAAQPQPRRDHHGQCHPHDAALFLDAELIGLHLSQIAWLLDKILMQSGPDGRSSHQAATVRSSNPNAATIACTGHPWASKVTTITTVSAEVRSR